MKTLNFSNNDQYSSVIKAVCLILIVFGCLLRFFEITNAWKVEQADLQVVEVPVGPVESASELGGVARGRWPPAVLNELVAIAFIVEPRQTAPAAGYPWVVVQVAEVESLARPVATAEREPGRVVILQVVDEGSEEDGLARPARADHADTALRRLPTECGHGPLEEETLPSFYTSAASGSDLRPCATFAAIHVAVYQIGPRKYVLGTLMHAVNRAPK